MPCSAGEEIRAMPSTTSKQRVHRGIRLCFLRDEKEERTREEFAFELELVNCALCANKTEEEEEGGKCEQPVRIMKSRKSRNGSLRLGFSIVASLPDSRKRL